MGNPLVKIFLLWCCCSYCFIAFNLKVKANVATSKDLGCLKRTLAKLKQHQALLNTESPQRPASTTNRAVKKAPSGWKLLLNETTLNKLKDLNRKKYETIQSTENIVKHRLPRKLVRKNPLQTRPNKTSGSIRNTPNTARASSSQNPFFNLQQSSTHITNNGHTVAQNPFFNRPTTSQNPFFQPQKPSVAIAAQSPPQIQSNKPTVSQNPFFETQRPSVATVPIQIQSNGHTLPQNPFFQPQRPSVATVQQSALQNSSLEPLRPQNPVQNLSQQPSTTIILALRPSNQVSKPQNASPIPQQNGHQIPFMQATATKPQSSTQTFILPPRVPGLASQSNAHQNAVLQSTNLTQSYQKVVVTQIKFPTPETPNKPPAQSPQSSQSQNIQSTNHFTNGHQYLQQTSIAQQQHVPQAVKPADNEFLANPFKPQKPDLFQSVPLEKPQKQVPQTFDADHVYQQTQLQTLKEQEKNKQKLPPSKAPEKSPHLAPPPAKTQVPAPQKFPFNINDFYQQAQLQRFKEQENQTKKKPEHKPGPHQNASNESPQTFQFNRNEFYQQAQIQKLKEQAQRPPQFPKGPSSPMNPESSPHPEEKLQSQKPQKIQFNRNEFYQQAQIQKLKEQAVKPPQPPRDKPSSPMTPESSPHPEEKLQSQKPQKIQFNRNEFYQQAQLQSSSKVPGALPDLVPQQQPHTQNGSLVKPGSSGKPNKPDSLQNDAKPIQLPELQPEDDIANQPARPVEPLQPTKTNQPDKPSRPAQLIQDADFGKPAHPHQPARPIEPIQPSKLDPPNQSPPPVEPPKPVQSIEHDQPINFNRPAEPFQFEKPALPLHPAQIPPPSQLELDQPIKPAGSIEHDALLQPEEPVQQFLFPGENEKLYCYVNGSPERLGVCTRYTLCTRAQEEWRKSGHRPQHCYFDGETEYICCEKSGVTNNSVDSEEEENMTRAPLRRCEQACRDDENRIYPPIQEFNQVKDFPFMAALGYTPKSQEMYIHFLCSGVLISRRHVLTAAYCTNLKGEAPKFVSLGGSTVFISPLDDKSVVEVNAIIIHPKFDEARLSHDIALIELKKDIFHLKPLCLWTQKEDMGSGVTATVSYESIRKVGPTFWSLLYSTVHLVSDQNCSSYYPKEGGILPQGLDLDTQVCGTYIQHHENPCPKQPGAPLLMTVPTDGVKKQTDYVFGLSLGQDCEYSEMPLIFTKVSYFIDWIEDIVWPFETRFDTRMGGHV